jgi:D-sedoheptulose 7-phosphate isomerase
VNDDASLDELIHSHFTRSAELKLETLRSCAGDIRRAAALIADAFRSGNKLLICGNGGSAADAQHMAAEFVSRLTRDFDRPALPAVALTTDTSILTAYANDFDFDGVFARQVEALGRREDVLLGISTSGSSRNVVKAAAAARSAAMKVIALVGRAGTLSDVGDVSIRIPSNSTAHIQECHITVEHIICNLVERMLFARPRDSERET